MPAFQFVIHEATTGVILAVTKGACRRPATAVQPPTGCAVAPVPPDHDVLQHAYRWKVVGGQLVEKVGVTLSAALTRVTSAPTVSATVLINQQPFPLVNGQLVLATALAVGTRVHVAPTDPAYYSDPIRVA